MHSALAGVLVVAVACLAAGCGEDPNAAEPKGTVIEQPTPTPSATETVSPTPERAPVELGGDAATNKACQLATVEEVEQVTGYTVWMVEGLPVGFRGDLGCIWRLVAVDYGGPALTVYWDRKDTDAAGKTALYRQLIQDKQRSEVRGFGDVASQDGSAIDVITGRQWLFLTLRLRQIATPDDQRMNRELLQIMYPRTQR